MPNTYERRMGRRVREGMMWNRLKAGVVASAVVGASLTGVAVMPAQQATADTTDVIVSVGRIAVLEGGGGVQQVSVPLNLSRPVASVVTAQVVVGGGTATRDLDWTAAGKAPAGPTVTVTASFRAGAVSADVKVGIVGDTFAESSESLLLALTGATGASLGTTAGDVTIIDDDTTPTVGIGVGDATIDEGDAGARNVKLPITLTAALPGPVTATVSRSTTSSATASLDDAAKASKTITIPAGKTAATLAVKILPDELAESNETVVFTLASSSVAVVRSTGTISIADGGSTDVGAVTTPPADDAGFYAAAGQVGRTPGSVIYSKVIETTAQWTQYLMLYSSTGEMGGKIVVTGRVWVPTTAAPAGGFDVIAWAPGSVGLNDACAPSRYNVAAWAPADLAGLIAAGYVVVATDYEGLGTPGPHPYFGSRSESQTIFDAVRAAADLGVNISRRTVLLGWSRGGHAVVAASERTAYAPDLDVRGAVGLGAGVVQADEYAINLILAFNPGYAMMVLRGISSTVGETSGPVKQFKAHYLTPNGIAQLPDAEIGCLFDVFARFNGQQPSTLFNLFRPAASSTVQAIRDRVTTGKLGNDVPLLLMSGSYDATVPPQVINPWLGFACAQIGRTAPIENRYYPTNHSGVGTTPPASELESWIAARFAGSPATDQCP